MKVFVGVLAIAVCIAAEPALYNYDLPYYYNYRHLYSPVSYPIKPIVRDLIPGVYPANYPFHYYAGLKSQYDDRDFIGQSRYGHIEPGQSHHAVQDAFGNKVGGYSYYDAEGKLVRTSYVADAAGFRVLTNNLPEVVRDTPEVLAAKEAHFVEHEKIKNRSRRDAPLLPASVTSIETPLSRFDYRIAAPIPYTLPTTYTVPVVKPDGFLADTPEVAAAKSIHFAELEAAKLRTISPIVPIVPPVAPLIPHAFPTTSSFPVVKPDGFLADTPEVAAAKSIHFAELEAAKLRTFSPIVPSVAPVFPVSHAFPTTHTVPIVKPDGFLADTPEVAAAKSIHFAELEAAKLRTFSSIVPLGPIDYRYVSPVSHTVPVVTRDGFLIDTPEVLAEKARHFAEVAKARL